MNTPTAADIALRATLVPRGACRRCRAILAKRFNQRRSVHLLASSGRADLATKRPPKRPFTNALPSQFPQLLSQQVLSRYISSHQDATSQFQEAERLVTAILSARRTIPSDEDTLKALEACESAAHSMLQRAGHAPTKQNRSGPTPAISLLSLDLRPSPAEPLSKPLETLSNLAYALMGHPTVFISPKVLSTYVSIQSLLHRPETFPEIFKLYAQKPAPRHKGNDIEYIEPNPNKVTAAVESKVANAALSSAILKKSLFTALDIVDNAYCTNAYRRAKIVRKALPPITGFALAPVAAYALASEFAEWQNSMEPSTATGVAAAGILAYVGATSTIGYVAVTTANDQMDRVTWASGTPLYERWLREDERAAIDRVAGAWGFQEVWKRGEEEGEEWEFLREWIGYRGMILDRSDLMEGME